MRIQSVDVPKYREYTRLQRHTHKASTAITMPVSVATMNFSIDVNVAYSVRAAACYGASEVCVIGSLPEERTLKALSGSTNMWVEIKQFSRPEDFMEYSRRENIKLLSLELPDEYATATPIGEFRYDFNKKYCLIAGHETIGIPPEILFNSERVYIPMMGVGFCINTSQAVNVALYEASKQYMGRGKC